MANLKEIRTRLSSVKSTRQITSAMKMVSAAKLRRAQDAIILLRPYAVKLNEIYTHLSGSIVEEHDNIYGHKREVNKVLLVVISSNKGLCGAFNINVGKNTLALIENRYQQLNNDGLIDIMAIGKKGADYIVHKGYNITESLHGMLDDINYEVISSLASRIMNSFVSGEYDEVKIIYNQFKNAGIQNLRIESYLPILPPHEMETDIVDHAEYLLEPSKKQIIEDLIPKTLKMQLYKAFLESIASEHGARMTAMHKATDNASELIYELQLDYNKARQASITTEILEIVGGAEALKK